MTQERGGSVVLRDLTLDLPRGGITALVGPSGAGKTSLIRLLNRLDDPTRGEVAFDGRPITDYPVAALRRRVGFVFQAPAMFPGTVADNLRTAVELGGAGAAADAPPAERVLAAVELSPDYASRVAERLSGGEQQRVSLARALMTHPEVLLLDEPTSALDPEVAERLLGDDRAVDARARRGGRDGDAPPQRGPGDQHVHGDARAADAWWRPGPPSGCSPRPPARGRARISPAPTEAHGPGLRAHPDAGHLRTAATTLDVTWPDLALVAMLVLVAIALSRWQRLGLERGFLVGAAAGGGAARGRGLRAGVPVRGHSLVAGAARAGGDAGGRDATATRRWRGGTAAAGERRGSGASAGRRCW